MRQPRLGPARQLATAMAVALLLLASLSAAGQGFSSDLQIVASIRKSVDNDPGMVIRPAPKGTYSAVKVTVLALLTSGFGLTPDRVIGAPPQTQRYDIEARFVPDGPDAPAPDTPAMLQAVLRSRFGLRSHVEQRPFPVYLLKVARLDGRLGPQLNASSVACGDAPAANDARSRGINAPNGAPACGALEDPETFVAGGTTMEVLARALRIPTGRPVVNATGLSGTWDVALRFTPLREVPGDRPYVFTAIEEELGLRLEPATAPLDVLVVDAISEPSPN